MKNIGFSDLKKRAQIFEWRRFLCSKIGRIHFLWLKVCVKLAFSQLCDFMKNIGVFFSASDNVPERVVDLIGSVNLTIYGVS